MNPDEFDKLYKNLKSNLTSAEREKLNQRLTDCLTELNSDIQKWDEVEKEQIIMFGFSQDVHDIFRKKKEKEKIKSEKSKIMNQIAMIKKIQSKLGIVTNKIMQETTNKHQDSEDNSSQYIPKKTKPISKKANMSSIFISHKESDHQIASALVDFLLLALKIDSKSILCTSVPGHKLNFKNTIAQQIKENIQVGKILIALFTKKHLESPSLWMMYELGAAWALDRTTILIIGPGLPPDNRPDPLKEWPYINITDNNISSRIMESIDEIAQELGLEKGDNSGKIQSKLNLFIEEFYKNDNKK